MSRFIAIFLVLLALAVDHDDERHKKKTKLIVSVERATYVANETPAYVVRVI